MASDPPDEVLRLVAERDQRRAVKDFAEADRLRDRIAVLGYRVVDGSRGSVLERVEASSPPETARVRPEQVASVLERPATDDVSVHWLIEGWPQDVARGIESFRAFEGERRVQHVVVDVSGATPDAVPAGGEFVALEAGTGFAAARNAGLRRASGRTVLLVDGSIEATGDVFAPLEAALADPKVGLAGPFGIVTRDLHAFAPSAGVGTERAVDAIEGYLIALRRGVLTDVGLLDERFRFYRTCDVEYSFRVKDAGLETVVVDLPVRRHTHRVWEATSEHDRARLSKRNYYRFLDRYRGRFDLTVQGKS